MVPQEYRLVVLQPQGRLDLQGGAVLGENICLAWYPISTPCASPI